MKDRLPLQSHTRAWLRQSALEAHIAGFWRDLKARGYAAGTRRVYLCCVAHFAHWVRRERLALKRLDEDVVARYLAEHLSRCDCPKPVRRLVHENRAALIHLLATLRACGAVGDASGHRGPLTRQLITRWTRDEAKRKTPLTWARRLEVIRPFAKHRARIEPRSYVPAADTFGRCRRRLAPHVYTDGEIVDLLAAAGRLSPRGTLRSATYRALFGLIAATGLRVSEALRLQCADVDLDAGMLTVRQTKFTKSRLVPLHPTAVRTLKQYLALRRRHLPTAQDGPFLASAGGTALAKRTVQWVFDQLRKQLGWTARGGYAAPRIHDLRHTFICRRVQLWHEHGTDIDNAMVALSTYVGHAKVSNTYWYLTAAPDLMSVAGCRFERFVEADNA